MRRSPGPALRNDARDYSGHGQRPAVVFYGIAFDLTALTRCGARVHACDLREA
jgi:hypothetical protein